MKELILLRGVPGSGKTTLANIIEPEYNIAADDYFDLYHGGTFSPEKIKQAHQWCKQSVSEWMDFERPKIVVHNTFTRAWEMEDYLILAEENGYRVHTVVVENRHGSSSIHKVPPETVEKMRNRFEVTV